MNNPVCCGVDRQLGKEAKGSQNSRIGAQNPTW